MKSLILAACILACMIGIANAQRECGGGPCGIGDKGRLYLIPGGPADKAIRRQAAQPRQVRKQVRPVRPAKQ
jgi:hypothetical protein